MPTRNSGGPIHASIVPNCAPSIMRGIDPSWLAGKIWPLICPLLRFSSRAMYRLHHSCWTSFSVAVAHLKAIVARSEEHTSELQSQSNLVCRLLLEKKKTYRRMTNYLQHTTTR